jgi:hypothetical protein
VVLEKDGEYNLERSCKQKANVIGYILRRNCLLKQAIKGKIKGGLEVTGRQGRRRRKLQDDLKGRRGYCHLEEEALDCTMWRARFGIGFGPVVRQTAKGVNEYVCYYWVSSPDNTHMTRKHYKILELEIVTLKFKDKP